MDALPGNVWKRLSRLFPADEAAAAQAAEFFREYESKGYLNRPSADILKSELTVIVDFFRRVALMHSSESPILRRRDTRWMFEYDYTLVNIRAAGIEARPGNFLRASLFLATLRTRGIILAPITKGATEDLEALESHAHIREELADKEALEAGITPEIQALAFCEAAHLLSLALGFELDYRVDPLAAVVLNRPDFFFWTKDGLFTSDESVQNKLRNEVKERVASVRKTGVPMDRKVYASALEMTGLAALPSSDGSLRTALALRLASETGIGEHRDAAVAYWGRVFDLWRDRYKFDFLVLRGTREPEGGNPEIPDRSLVRKVADTARKAGVRHTVGVAAEGNALDVESFGVQGVDIVIENDAEAKADYDWFKKTFALDEKLCMINKGRKIRFSVPLTVDPGEKESRPRRERAHIKRFVTRFLGAGPSRRPLLETMGALEDAWGYRATITRAVSMGWMPDASDAAVNQSIEDVALYYKDMIDDGEKLDKHIGERSAWWVIRSRKGLLIAVISVENEGLMPPESMKIDYSSYLKEKETMSVLEYDFHGDRGLLHLSADTFIDTGTIPYRGFRLYAVI